MKNERRFSIPVFIYIFDKEMFIVAKVLIVDDDVSLCRLLKYFLEGNSLSADCVHKA